MGTRPFAVICITSVVGAFLLGRCSAPRVPPAPAAVAETAKHQGEEKVHEDKAAATTKNTTKAAAVAKHAVTRKFRPDGTLASERVDDVDARSAEASKTDAVSVQTVYRDRIVNNETTRTVMAPERPWAASALAGLDWSGRRIFGAEVTHRFVGPVARGVRW